MKNTEYKCMCCGWQGSEENQVISTARKIAGIQEELENCPECGSIDIYNVLKLERMPV